LKELFKLLEIAPSSNNGGKKRFRKLKKQKTTKTKKRFSKFKKQKTTKTTKTF
jgi:hypothetical protein